MFPCNEFLVVAQRLEYSSAEFHDDFTFKWKYKKIKSQYESIMKFASNVVI